MSFWSDPSDAFPKQAYRWVISFGKQNDNSKNIIPYYFAKSVERPSMKIDTVRAKYLYSHTFNFPKRVEWNPIKIVFHDVIIDNSSDKEFILNPKINGASVSQTPPYKNDNFKLSTQYFFQKIMHDRGKVEMSHLCFSSISSMHFLITNYNY